MEEKVYKKVFAYVIFTLALFFMTPHFVNAASLYFAPASGTYNSDGNFSVSINVSSADQAMNAVQVSVSFPSDKLEVTSLSKTGSVMSLWVQEPSFSNGAGSVNFEGIVLNPGYTGASGKIITINFKAKSSGEATLIFSSGSVLANDGKGTNILIGLGSAQYNLGAPAPSAPPSAPPEPAAPPSGTPAAPRISSNTHPDSGIWYSERNAGFSWPVSSNIMGVRLLVGKNSSSNPTVIYEPPIFHREITDLDDGVWYFHVQMRNSSGWGGVSHFRFQVDATQPSAFKITEILRPTSTDSCAEFSFSAIDETSGIDHYEVQIDGLNTENWYDENNGRYKTPALASGKHTLIARAVDKAGNYRTETVDFIIEGISSPTVLAYSDELWINEFFSLKGSTYPLSKVKIWVQKIDGTAVSFDVESDSQGNFVFTKDNGFEEGVFEIWTEVTTPENITSGPSEKILLKVLPRQVSIKVKESWLLNPYLLPVLWTILIVLVATLVWHLIRRLELPKIRQCMAKQNTRSTATDDSLNQTIDALRDEIKKMSKQITNLEHAKAKVPPVQKKKNIIKRIKIETDEAEQPKVSTTKKSIKKNKK